MADDIIELRLKCARAIGKEVVADGSLDGFVYVRQTSDSAIRYQPDLDNDQLVELIEWLRTQKRRWALDAAMQSKDWKLAIMKAVAQIGGESE